MYRIVDAKTGALVGYTEALTYIYLSKNGCYAICPKNRDPQGISYNSIPYNLLGKESMGDDVDTVMLQEIDPGSELNALRSENESLSTQLTESQLALCDVYEQLVNSEQQVTETQLALCDVYEQLIALTTQTEGGEPT